ncbi:hypothetical protein R3W88_005005 [Solanum pinnatisectum]|uniref:Uncharacterized protein n=1 Tax=Solanum pinnatisectum TaxID=50273 RepID=A0AAV9KBC2_9SOLN|nr:hypothetical protein R3W88_005005 [Solanum pinnatisectum]
MHKNNLCITNANITNTCIANANIINTLYLTLFLYTLPNNLLSVQECHDKVIPISIHNSPKSISSHKKCSNSREQMELMKTMNIPVN